LIANSIFLAAAGHETTARLICNAVHALLRDPSHRTWSSHEPVVDRASVEELCRWEPTVQVAPRMLRKEAEIGGVLLPPGQVIWNFLGAANRDEREFPDPDTLDLARTHNPHLAFGSGIHSCLGAALGRAEIEVAVNTLFAELPGVSLAIDHVRYNENLTLRGPERVPLRWPRRSFPPGSGPSVAR
jgi:hypothetical protein